MNNWSLSPSSTSSPPLYSKIQSTLQHSYPHEEAPRTMTDLLAQRVHSSGVYDPREPSPIKSETPPRVTKHKFVRTAG